MWLVGVKRYKARACASYIYSDAQGVRGGPWLRVVVRVPVRVAVRVKRFIYIERRAQVRVAVRVVSIENRVDAAMDQESA